MEDHLSPSWHFVRYLRRLTRVWCLRMTLQHVCLPWNAYYCWSTLCVPNVKIVFIVVHISTCPRLKVSCSNGNQPKQFTVYQRRECFCTTLRYSCFDAISIVTTLIRGYPSQHSLGTSITPSALSSASSAIVTILAIVASVVFAGTVALGLSSSAALSRLLLLLLLLLVLVPGVPWPLP